MSSPEELALQGGTLQRDVSAWNPNLVLGSSRTEIHSLDSRKWKSGS